jgi:hypothetical protein
MDKLRDQEWVALVEMQERQLAMLARLEARLGRE